MSLTPKAKHRMRLEMPWIILLAMLVGTFVAAYKSEQTADAAASKRFQETAQSAYMNLQHELEATQDLLESTAAFVSMMPSGSIDASANVIIRGRGCVNDTYLITSTRRCL